MCTKIQEGSRNLQPYVCQSVILQISHIQVDAILEKPGVVKHHIMALVDFPSNTLYRWADVEEFSRVKRFSDERSAEKMKNHTFDFLWKKKKKVW